MYSGWTFYTPYPTTTGPTWWSSALLLLVALVLTLVSCAGLAWLWWRALKPPHAMGPRCGGCGYPVRGLDAMRCPECGGSFFEAGIRIAKRPLGVIAFGVLWLLAFILPALVAGTLLVRFGPQKAEAVYGFYITPKDYNSDIQRVEIRAAPVRRAASPGGNPSRLFILTIVGHKANYTAVADLDAMLLWRDNATARTPLSEAVLLAWMVESGFIEKPDINATANTTHRMLAAITRASHAGPLSMQFNPGVSVTDRTTYRYAPKEWWTGLVIVACVGVYLVGLWVYVRRRRTSKAQPADAQPTAIRSSGTVTP